MRSKTMSFTVVIVAAEGLVPCGSAGIEFPEDAWRDLVGILTLCRGEVLLVRRPVAGGPLTVQLLLWGGRTRFIFALPETPASVPVAQRTAQMAVEGLVRFCQKVLAVGN